MPRAYKCVRIWDLERKYRGVAGKERRGNRKEDAWESFPLLSFLFRTGPGLIRLDKGGIRQKGVRL